MRCILKTLIKVCKPRKCYKIIILIGNYKVKIYLWPKLKFLIGGLSLALDDSPDWLVLAAAAPPPRLANRLAARRKGFSFCVAKVPP